LYQLVTASEGGGADSIGVGIAFYVMAAPVVGGTAIGVIVLSVIGLVLAWRGFQQASRTIAGEGVGWCVGGLLFHGLMAALLLWFTSSWFVRGRL
jgi:hypothetical protein